MFFLLCPATLDFLCSLSAATFRYVREYPLPPVTPDLKPKTVGGAGQTRGRGCSGARLLLWCEDEALTQGATDRRRGWAPAFPAAGRDGFELGAALRRFLKVASQKPDWAGVRRGQYFSLNVALNLALVPSKTLSIHLLAKPPRQPDPFLQPGVPSLTLNTSARGQDTELEQRSCPLRPHSASLSSLAAVSIVP